MFENTLIAQENHWLLFAILFVGGFIGLWVEKAKWNKRLPSVVVTILFTFILSNLSIIPNEAPAYGIVWSYLVPLAIPLLLFRANLKAIFTESGPTMIAFILGGIGTIIGTIVAYYIIPLGDEGWRLAGIFCATYIGGTVNYLASAEALQLTDNALLTAGIAADNLMMTLYFLILFALPSIGFLQKRFKTHHEDNVSANNSSDKINEYESETLNLMDMSKSFAIALSVCAVGMTLGDLTGFAGSGILIITALIVLIATLFPKQMTAIKGADKLGVIFLQVFFAALGASANIGVVLSVGPLLFFFAAIILFIHLAFLLIAGKLFKLDLAEIVVASNANMGGPTTAVSMAVARRWQDLIIPAILCGTFGYAIATFAGVAIGYLVK